MDAWLWRLIDWRLNRHLTIEQAQSARGDLLEDLSDRERKSSYLRTRFWLLTEAFSVAEAYGSRERRERRQSRRSLMGGSWGDDLRLARRRLTRNPAGTLAAVVTLACSIAAAAATWTIVSSVLLHPIAIHEAGRVMLVTDALRLSSPEAEPRTAFVYPLVQSVRDSQVFDGIAAGGDWQMLVTDSSSIPQPRTVFFATHDFFSTLGVALAAGTGFSPRDDVRGAPLTAILSHQYWRSAFAQDPNVIGRTIRVANKPTTIVGIAPKPFRGWSLAEPPDLYMPLHAIAQVGDERTNFFALPLSVIKSSPTAWIRIAGRLKPGDSATDAARRLRAVSRDAPIFGDTMGLAPVETFALPFVSQTPMQAFARLLSITVSFLVFIGALTVGMLLLIRTEARRDEFAMCMALGGTRLSLLRGVFFEGALLAFAGAALAIPIASWLFRGLSGYSLPGQVEIDRLDLAVDLGTLAAVAASAAAIMLVITAVGGLLGVSTSVADVLRSRSGGTPRIVRRKIRATLVAAQVAISLVLLTGAVLFSRSLTAALSLNTGFDAGRIVTGQVGLRGYGYTPERADAFFDELRPRLDRLPGAQSVSLSLGLGAMTPAGKILVDGVPRQFPSVVQYIAVDERYFSTMQMRIVEGRDFSERDTMSSPLVLIVSESLGRAIAGTGSPIGHRMAETSAKIGQAPAVAEIVGVVPDVIRNVTNTSPLVKYYALRQQETMPARNLTIRTSPGRASEVLSGALGAIRSLDPQVTPAPMMTIEEQLRSQMSAQDLGGTVMWALGLIATLLTLLGAYVLAESTTSARARELSIRRAVGASRLTLGGLVVSETLRLVGLGIIVGLGLAWMGAETIRSLLYRVEPLDPSVLVLVCAGILGVTTLVSLKPAIDAGRTDLTTLLRDE